MYVVREQTGETANVIMLILPITVGRNTILYSYGYVRTRHRVVYCRWTGGGGYLALAFARTMPTQVRSHQDQYRQVYAVHIVITGDERGEEGSAQEQGVPGGALYIHRCFVVFRNALITFYGRATAAAAAHADVVVPRAGWEERSSGERWRRLRQSIRCVQAGSVRFSWLFHSRPITSQQTATHREHVVRVDLVEVHNTVALFFFFFIYVFLSLHNFTNGLWLMSSPIVFSAVNCSSALNL